MKRRTARRYRWRCDARRWRVDQHCLRMPHLDHVGFAFEKEGVGEMELVFVFVDEGGVGFGDAHQFHFAVLGKLLEDSDDVIVGQADDGYAHGRRRRLGGQICPCGCHQQHHHPTSNATSTKTVRHGGSPWGDCNGDSGRRGGSQSGGGRPPGQPAWRPAPPSPGNPPGNTRKTIAGADSREGKEQGQATEGVGGSILPTSGERAVYGDMHA